MKPCQTAPNIKLVFILFTHWQISHAFLLSAGFFFIINFFENSFRNMIRVATSFDPDQAQHFVGPDLVLNCLQRLSAYDKIGRWQANS